MNTSSRTIIAIVSSALVSFTASAAENKATIKATSPVLVIKLTPSANTNEVKVTPPKIVVEEQPVVKEQPAILDIWKNNRGGEWTGGDRSKAPNSFYNASNWGAPTTPRSEGEGVDLILNGSSSQAHLAQSLSLLNSSSLVTTGGASFDLDSNIVIYSGKAALIVDSSYLDNIGGMKPNDKDSTLDLIITSSAMVNGVVKPGVVCDLGNGSLLVSDSTCNLSSIVAGKVKISGYGNVEVSSNSKDVIKDTTIDLTSPRAQFRFVNKSVDRVISEDLDKFSISGGLPIYGSNPGVVEVGDNILIRDDGGAGTTLTVVK